MIRPLRDQLLQLAELFDPEHKVIHVLRRVEGQIDEDPALTIQAELEG